MSAQPGRLRHIGFIVPRLSSTDPARAAGVAAFHRAMQERGYRVGRDYRFDERSVEGRNERYDEVAAQLVANRVDPILVPGTSGAQAAQRATATTPIVFLSISDPVGTALVTSLARPGGNLTGRPCASAGCSSSIRRRSFQQASASSGSLAERLPTMFQASRWVRLGGLMSYGPNAVDDMHHVATYVINLKSGRTMGLAIPPSLLLRADEVTE